MIRILVAPLVLCVAIAEVRLCANEQNQPQGQPPGSASSNTSTPAGYVQIAPLMIVQPPGIANHRVHPALSGRVPGVAISAGAFVTSAFAVEGEVVWAGTISTPQQFSYTWREDYTAQDRDVLLNVNLRWHPRRQRYLEVFGGGGLAISTFANRSIVRTDSFPERTSILPDEQTTSRNPALGAGFAGVVPIGRAVALVPRFSVRWVKRPADGLGGYMGAFSSAWQVGAALRFNLGRTP
jgi:hypothetical protein